MLVFDTPLSLKNHIASLKEQGKTIALVPTMGPLHVGHLALMQKAKSLADVVILANCLNKLQLGMGDPAHQYEEKPQDDLSICEQAGVDILFCPTMEALYPATFSTYLFEERLSKTLGGPSRPNWFRGLVTLFVIYINLVRPEKVVLGERDYQSVAVLQKVVQDLWIPTHVEVVPTVRDENGLALSYRSQNLTPSQRQEAERIFKALELGKRMVLQGTRSPERVIAEITHHLSQTRRIRILYVAAVDSLTLEPLRSLEPGHGRLMVGVWVDELRLLDTLAL